LGERGEEAMREVVGSVAGALAIGLFVGRFAWTMSQTQQPGVDAGLMWLWAIVASIVFVAIMGTWHRVVAPGARTPRTATPRAEKGETHGRDL
jgi:hypothetical protein